MKLFDDQEHLLAPYNKIIRNLAILYLIAICLMCFLPQSVYPTVKTIETPGIQHFGRVVAILTPFNTLVHLGKVPNLSDLFYIVLQNVANIFLLFPLILALCLLRPDVRQLKKVVVVSFLMSLTIETSQAILDLLFDFNRVFEIDDLITNTVGGILAYGCYQWIRKVFK